MILNAAQYQALFTNAFGGDPSEFDITIDDSGDVAIGRVGTHTIELQVVQQRPIAWKVDGETLLDWPGVLKPDDTARARNLAALSTKLG
jgi:hypothetical protein